MENSRLQQAIESAQLGFYDQARIILLKIVREDPHNELAWLWLAQTLDDPVRQRDCLQQVLRINPYNEDALRGAEALQTGQPLPEPGLASVTSPESELLFPAFDEPEPELLSPPPIEPGVDLYKMLDASSKDDDGALYSDSLYVEESPTAQPAEDFTPESLADTSETDLFDAMEQDEVLEPSAIFEMTAREPVTEPALESESFLERARRARAETAMPPAAPAYTEEEAPSATDPDDAAVAPPAKQRPKRFARRRARREKAPLLDDAGGARSTFRLFDRRVLLGILGLVQLPILAGLLFLVLRGGGIGGRTTARPTASACRALDLTTFTSVETLGGALTADTVFTGTEVLVSETIVVPFGQRLALYPGATLAFTRGATIEVYGALFACGGSGSPVAFTAVEKTPGGWEGIRLYNPTDESVLSHAVIEYAGERALALHDSPVVLGDVRIAQSVGFPISLDGNRVPDLSHGVDVNDNPFQGVEVRPGTVTVASAVWSDYGLPYIVTGLVRVDDTATLDVKSGAVVKFWRPPGGQLPGVWVRGLLKAEDVHFTSLHDSSEEVGGATYREAVDPQPGDWGSITFFESSAKSYLRNVVVRYGGKSTGAIVIRQSAPELTNVTVTDAAVYPITADVNAYPELRDLTLANNVAGDVLEIRGGDASVESEPGEFVWHVLGAEDDSPIVRLIRDVLVIGPETTLTIDPGVIVKFAKEGQIVVQGTLAASGGTGAERIVFTSMRDDDYGGDTDGHTAQRDSREWGGIVFDEADAASVLQNALVRYAPVMVRSASPKLVGVQVVDALGAGLRLSPDSAPELMGSNFVDNELHGIAILTGTMTSDMHWTRLGGARDQMVRILVGEVTVGERAALQIDAGTIIKAGPAGKLTMLGDLEAVGLGTQSVIFTALRDDTWGGDTDGSLSEPGAGDWLGVELGPEANARLGNVAIFYAQYGLSLLGETLPVVEDGHVHIANGVNALRCVAPLQIPVEFLIENNAVDTARCPAE